MGVARAQPAQVGTALVLLIDVSGSVDNTEYELQKEGVATAFRDPGVVKAIWNQPFGRMAVAVVEWSDNATVVIPWTIIEDDTGSARFASLVDNIDRTSRGSTALGSASRYSRTSRLSPGKLRAERARKSAKSWLVSPFTIARVKR